MVVDKGDDNHHNRSYKIQVTKTGRTIKCNRQHIKPTPITAENFLCNQLSKHTKDAILGHIQKHPPPPTAKNITNGKPSNSIMPDAQLVCKTVKKTKGRKKTQMEYRTINTPTKGKG